MGQRTINQVEIRDKVLIHRWIEKDGRDLVGERKRTFI